MITPEEYQDLRDRMTVEGFHNELLWSESLGPCETAMEFAQEAIFVICNSGMQNGVARGIYDRTMAALYRDGSAHDAFGHKGKCGAIMDIWSNQDEYFSGYRDLCVDEDRLDFLGELPWIGTITKYHLAKNLGMDVCKPDRWLMRLAMAEGTTPPELCCRLAKASGDRVATVDLVLWRSCAEGWLDA